MATRNATSSPSPRFSLDSLRMPLAALGVFGILAGLGAWLVEGQFDLPPRILLAGGILLLGIYVALDPEDVWARVTGRSTLISGNVLVVALAAIVILGLFNVLASRYQTKWDTTANQQFTLSQQSVQVVQQLPQPVHATAFFPASDNQRQTFQTLLSNYAAQSNGKFTFDFIDPEARPGDAVNAGITQEGTTVFSMGDKKQNATGTTEQDVTTALVKLTRPEKKIYFTTGHGERNLDGFDQPDYGQIKQALERDNYTTDTLNPTTTRAVPDDAAAVVIAGATAPLLQEELDTLKAYADGGGSIFILQDPNSKADFSGLLSPYGVAIPGTLVVDPSQNYLGDVRVPVVSKYGNHETTQDLRVASFFPGSTYVTYPTSGAGTTITPIAQTSDQSWANSNSQQIQKQDGDVTGPLTLALAIQAPVAGGASPTPVPPPDPNNPTPPDTSSGKQTRIYVITTANLVANAFLSVSSGNQDLFLNATNWLSEEDNLVNIKVPQPVSRTMLLTGPQLNLVTYSSLLFLPLLVLAVGIGVWWSRR
jgi:ABC-type uncharacterized transport system involved in gliding motility auxiliary subunit